MRQSRKCEVRTVAAIDFRIHMALSMCAAALERGPELPQAARIMIIGAMEMLLGADEYIDNKME